MITLSRFKPYANNKAKNFCLKAKVHLAVHKAMKNMPIDQTSGFLSLTKQQNLLYFLIRHKHTPTYLMSGEMLEKVSHSYRSYFQGLFGATDFLKYLVKETSDLNTIRKDLEKCSKEIEEMHQEVWAILHSVEIAHKAMGEFYMESNIDLNKILTDKTKISNGLPLYSNAGIRFNLASNLSLCELDKTKIEHVIINIFLNALQATQNQKQKTILISTHNTILNAKPGIEIKIKDNGHGIKAEFAQKIFEPFFTTKGCEGTGLGLPISRELIERHGGTLELANNTNGPGATATIRLPVKPILRS